MQVSQRAIAVIFAGGQGKRLWPLSTQQNPKQLNTAFSKESMLVEAYKRALQIFPKEDIVVVTTKQLVPATQKLINLDPKNLLVQPKNADTTAAMSLTAMYLEAVFPESIAVVLYSDQIITQNGKFKHALKQALDYAKGQDRIIAVGTRPTFGNTEYGYIDAGQPAITGGLFHVSGFVEKPSAAHAKQLVDSGQWLWNTGVKIWKVSVLLNALKQASPDIYQGLLNLRTFIGGPDYQQKLSEWYNAIEPTSFEESVTKKLPELYVYAADYTWEDIGNWQAIYRLAPKDAHGNAVQAVNTQAQEVRFVDSSGCLVVTDQEEVTIMGVHDLVVIHKQNLLFICNRDDATRIKELVDDQDAAG